MIHPVPKHHILRSEKYLDFVRQKPCFICSKPAEPHHERRHSDGGTGLKPSDIYAVPACREHHGQLQRYEILDTLTVYIQILRLLTEYLRGKI